MDVDALLADLDADQRRAVTTESTLVAVIAGAGSGKTRVLTRRVAYRIAARTADPTHTLVLTFTREAAGELRRRLRRLGISERVTAGTFHAICLELLRRRWADLDRRPRSVLDDRDRLLAGLIGEERADVVLEEVNWATARGHRGADYERALRTEGRRAPIPADRVATILDEYHELKRRRGVVDLDDLLAMTAAEIERDPEYAAVVRWRFRHLLVDEAQDLNPLQHRLVDRLREGANDLFLVGDPAQAIYGFNGADPRLLTEVERRFPGIEVIRLPSNHRSVPEVVATGAHALAATAHDSDVRSVRDAGGTVTVEAHTDEHEETVAVAAAVARADPDLIRNGQIAVLARTHAVLAPLRDALSEVGVDVRRPADGGRSRLGIALREVYRADSPNELRRMAVDLAERAESDDDVDRVIARALGEYRREAPLGDGPGFRTWVLATDPFTLRSSGVDLVTFHAAKGREWHTVHLIGCETSLVPHRSATSTAARDEEARLLYVAITRATDRLHLHWAERRGGYQRRRTPFLDGWQPDAPVVLPPPTSLVRSGRSSRAARIDRLREWRATAARTSGALPDAICSDRILSLIADALPASAAELDEATGLGAITSARWYPAIADALDEN